MEPLKKLFGALSLSQKIGLAVVFLAIAAGLSGFVRWRHEADFHPLFTSMSGEDAAAVVQKLKENGVEYRIGDSGTSVLVPEAKVDEVRIELAGAGLPRTGRIGFELFDKTNIGITDFTERVNYRRALEGELERSIKGISSIAQARVHLSFQRDSVFLDSQQPAKASVLVSLRPGAYLSPQNVSAMANLVASAVEGLTPDFVSIVDMQGNLLNRPRKAGNEEAAVSDALLDYRHQVEKDLMAKVESTLTPLLGEGKFRIGITADCDFTTSEQTDEVFDPTKSVMVTSQKTEDLAGGNQAAGVPGTASNLPRPAARPAFAGNSVSKRTENVAYATTRTVRDIKTPRGTVKRLSAALLLDEPFTWSGKGNNARRVSTPIPPEKLKAIHDLVAGLLGLDTQRGDQFVVESLPFEPGADTENVGTLAPSIPAPKGFVQWLKTNQIIVGAGALALVLFAGAAIWLVFKSKSGAAEIKTQKELPAGDKARPPAETAIEAAPAVTTPKLPPPPNKLDDLRQRVRDSVTRDPAVAANVIRSWLDSDN